MFEIVGFHHTGLTVRSLTHSIRFYVDLLGFEEVFRWNPRADYIGELVGYAGVDLHGAVLRIPGSGGFIELLEYKNVDEQPIDPRNGAAGAAHLALAVSQLDELFLHLKDNGVSFVSDPVTPTIGPNTGGRAVYAIDPDGFRVELIESPGAFDAGS